MPDDLWVPRDVGTAYSKPPWHERNLAWAPIAIGLGIISAVIAAMVKDVRWLLFFAWPFLAIGLWGFIRGHFSAILRRSIVTVGSIVIAAVLMGLYFVLPRPLITNTQPPAGTSPSGLGRVETVETKNEEQSRTVEKKTATPLAHETRKSFRAAPVDVVKQSNGIGATTTPPPVVQNNAPNGIANSGTINGGATGNNYSERQRILSDSDKSVIVEALTPYAGREMRIVVQVPYTEEMRRFGTDLMETATRAGMKPNIDFVHWVGGCQGDAGVSTYGSGPSARDAWALVRALNKIGIVKTMYPTCLYGNGVEDLPVTVVIDRP